MSISDLALGIFAATEVCVASLGILVPGFLRGRGTCYYYIYPLATVSLCAPQLVQQYILGPVVATTILMVVSAILWAFVLVACKSRSGAEHLDDGSGT